MIERRLGWIFASLWGAVILGHVAWPALAGLLEVGLYVLYGLAAFLGWLAGNVYVTRSRRLGVRGLLMLYLAGPPSAVALLRLLASPESQRAAPLVPIYALAVYAIFFLLPVSFRGMQDPPRRPRIGK